MCIAYGQSTAYAHKRSALYTTTPHACDGVGVAGGMRSKDVDLVEAFITQTTHVVLAARVHLAMTGQRRVVDETTITYLQCFTQTDMPTEL